MRFLVRNLSWLLVLSLLGGCSGKKEPGGDKTDSEPKTQKTEDSKKTEGAIKTPDKDGKPIIDETPSGISVSGEAISKAFRDDVKAASAKYRGKVIEVKSLVVEVGATVLGEGYVNLEGVTEPLPLPVECQTNDKEPWGKVVPGQTARVRGRCEVLSEKYQLRGCEVLEITGPGAVPVTATKLADDYAKDAATTARKYDDKYLLLSGEVEKTEVIEAMNTARIVLKTAGKIPISCVVEPSMLDQVKRLKPGQAVKLVGQQRPFSPTEGVDLTGCLLFGKP